ncbi:butyrophilin-like protein 2, partial [Clarias magur]
MNQLQSISGFLFKKTFRFLDHTDSQASAKGDDVVMMEQSESQEEHSGTSGTCSDTANTEMVINRNDDGEKDPGGEMINKRVEEQNGYDFIEAERPESKEENETTKQKDHETRTNILSGKRFFLLLSGNALNVHETIIDHFKRQTSDLQEVVTVDECDFILVFCPVVSRAGTDIEAALQKLQSSSETKPAVLVVLHHTFDPDCVVPDSSRAVHRQNTITVDCLFHEDMGLLQCYKNHQSLTRITELMQSQRSSSWSAISEYSSSWWPWSSSAPEGKTQCGKEEWKGKGQTESGSGGQAPSLWSWFTGSASEEKTQCGNKEGKEKDEKDQTEGESEASVSIWSPWSPSATETQNGNEEGNVQGQTKRKSEEYINICTCHLASADEKKLNGNEECKGKGLTDRNSGELRLMMLGTRSLQTAVTNIILGREDNNQAVITTPSQQRENTQGEVAGRKVIVMDTPDWFSPGLCLEDRLERIEDMDSFLHSPAPHVFLLVLHASQPKGEEKSFIEEMEKTLGASCWQNTMIIFIIPEAHQGNNQSGDQENQRFVDKCGKRVFCLNIKENGECSQVSELLEEIEKMVKERREKIYSNDIYKHSLVQIRELVKSMKEKIEKCEDPMKRGSKDLSDEETMRKFEQDLPEELQQRMEMEDKVQKAGTEEERNIMKIILPEIWKNILESNMKMHEKLSSQMEDRLHHCGLGLQVQPLRKRLNVEIKKGRKKMKKIKQKANLKHQFQYGALGHLQLLRPSMEIRKVMYKVKQKGHLK